MSSNYERIGCRMGIVMWMGIASMAKGATEKAVSAPGFPDRGATLDVRPGFVQPPAGYGEVPFWWWTGDDLNVERMVKQVRALHEMGISGVQVNYSHFDTKGWPTDESEPKIFSDAWWKVYQAISKACGKLDMGIGLSTYTLDWPRGGANLFNKLFYTNQAWNAQSLVRTSFPVKGGALCERTIDDGCFCVWAYPRVDGGLSSTGAVQLPVTDKMIRWTAPTGSDWEVWMYRAERAAGSFNPMMTGAGDTIIKGFFQPFEDKAPGKSSKGLNYFFNDELHIGTGKNAWNPDFPQEFRTRKGYDLFEVLPAFFGAKMGDGHRKAKVDIDYADVRMSLMEERYFKPIFNWHYSRGMIYACDPGSRGRNPGEFGDYFRANRWYSAPGHDTPGGRADLIKNKVSSSIANLYQRPRVWLEGYHSLGWGALPEMIMFATRENYLYGANLLNLHGLYYTTYGSYWEWAPPCYHFRMPYWSHMKSFFGYFERLSYLMSQGHLVADVAVVYPVAPYEAGMKSKEATQTAFTIADALFKTGINFEFIDHQSLERAVVKDGRLLVPDAQTAYQALVFPNMQAVRWTSMQKAVAFAQGGGRVYSVGELPMASDRAGSNDPELDRATGMAIPPAHRMTNECELEQAIRKAFVQDVVGVTRGVRALHRTAGTRDVYLVMDAQPGDLVEFRVKDAKVELWDPWTGTSEPLEVVKTTDTGTQVRLTLEPYEANVVVFTPGQKQVNPPVVPVRSSITNALSNEWAVAFEPTMDNTYGDFRMPVTKLNATIGVEARRFEWRAGALAGSKLHGFGTQFQILGPLPAGTEIQLSHVDVSKPVEIKGRQYRWTPYDFSWRMGREGDSGHQGFHGLKRTVTDDFLCLGKKVAALNESRYVDEVPQGVYYLWTTVTVDHPLTADVLYPVKSPEDKSHTSQILKIGAIIIDGEKVDKSVQLKKGTHPILVRFDSAGRGHFVLRDAAVPMPGTKEALAMRWYHDKGVIPFDVFAGSRPEEIFTFTTAPGTKALHLPDVEGEVTAFINDRPMKQRRDRFTIEPAERTAATVKLIVRPNRSGVTGGGLFDEPIKVETDGTGVMPLGDWSKIGILNNYSGGVRYTTRLAVSADESKATAEIDLGKVVGTAEVFVNGRSCGVRVAPPWKQRIQGLKAGENRIEILVFNSLANHYQTIPSRYHGDPAAGLFGPVQLILKP